MLWSVFIMLRLVSMAECKTFGCTIWHQLVAKLSENGPANFGEWLEYVTGCGTAWYLLRTRSEGCRRMSFTCKQSDTVNWYMVEWCTQNLDWDATVHLAPAMQQPNSATSTPLLWILIICATKEYSHSFRITFDMCAVSLFESRE